MQYSSFWNMYLYRPDSSVYILPSRPSGPRSRRAPDPANPALTPR